MTRIRLAARLGAATLALALAASAATFLPARSGAQQMPMDHGAGHGGQHMMGGTPPSAADSPAVAAYKAAAARMHQDMDIAYTGDADVDFVRGMIPHHAGAVAMAKIELAFGTDPEIRKLAEAVVKAQEEEIAFMKAWLEKKGAPAK